MKTLATLHAKELYDVIRFPAGLPLQVRPLPLPAVWQKRIAVTTLDLEEVTAANAN